MRTHNRVLISMMAFGLSAFLMGSATTAWFTHEVTVPNNSFTSGRIEMNVAHPSPVMWTGTYGNMAPGQTVTTNLIVRNTGTLDMKYRLYVQADNVPLAGALQLTIKKGSETLYSGPLNGLDLAHAIIRDGCNVLVPVGGATTERPATCTGPAGTNETLSVAVTLPNSAGNDLASKTTTASFIFRATQAENPGWDQSAP